MQQHYTPAEVAEALAVYLPDDCRRVLEPAVGGGTLLQPVRTRYPDSPPAVVGVDIDEGALDVVAARHADYRGRLDLIQGDFLSEDTIAQVRESGPFDCILMNPPFAAKRREWVLAPPTILSAYPQLKGNLIPPEIAFLLVALHLLSAGGRLIALVPSSVIVGTVGIWLREALLRMGRIITVHELSPFTFRGVEGRVYVLVFSKTECRATNSVVLNNHSLLDPEHLSVKIEDLGPAYRLDFGYHQAHKIFRELATRAPELGWRPLSEFATVIRGSVASPRGQHQALHTRDHKAGIWHVHRDVEFVEGFEAASTRTGDLMVARVGRGASRSFGMVTDIGRPCSDCVFIIRPFEPMESERLLFALRVIAGLQGITPLLEHGCGATYIPGGALRGLSIPYELSRIQPRIFAEFRDSFVNADSARRERLEVDAQVSVGASCDAPRNSGAGILHRFTATPGLITGPTVPCI